MTALNHSLQAGFMAHQQGRLTDAEVIYRQLLHQNPDQTDVIYLMGVLKLDNGAPEQAYTYLRRAIAVTPNVPEYHNTLGDTFFSMGRYDEAIAAYREAIRLNPNHDEFHLNLGIVLHQAQRTDAAITAYQQALRLNPTGWDILNNLGNVYRDANQSAQAIDCYRQSLALHPNGYEAHYNLAGLYKKQGDLDQAITHCRQAIDLHPVFAEAYDTLGTLLYQKDQTTEAIKAYRKAIELDPGFARGHYNLGVLYGSLEQVDNAVACYEKAIALKPDYLEALESLASALCSINQTEEALRVYQQAWGYSKSDAVRIRMALTFPSLHSSKDTMMQWRHRVSESIRALNHESLTLPNPVVDVGMTSFYLTYQGENDREIQEAIARLYRSVPRHDIPASKRAGTRTKPRIGFISRFFRTHHTIGKLMRGLFEHLDRDEFSVAIISLKDEATRNNPLPKHPSDTFLEIPLDDIAAACASVAALDLDILVYTDIGMEPTTYFMALSRLAPIQCAFWGHPVTTGLPEMDYFLSSRDLETEDCQNHYTEKVVRMDALNVYYHRPQLPQNPKTRADFNLPPKAHLYVCPQSLYKLHPDFDAIMGGILRKDPDGRIVLIHGNYKHFRQTLTERWQRTLPDVMDRILFLDSMQYEDFLSLQAISDVLLDPLHFGGGNTHYEALAFGTPIVTCPQPYMRSRICYALYQKMGITDCIAQTPDDYIDIAVRLGTDPNYRHAVRTQILVENGVLYEDMNVVRQWEAFFTEALEKHKNGETP